ncbi:KATNB1-like protein 1 isoform X2 [Pygocentrus nattereri]|uniref:KATNB1-like protein 1 isoform X2 n=1 Tax=Pygocentrus nattereri TaxID=42514 RepID=UPI0008146269|nr:KATNB1-like protein 1 isoform X2 [Pygocentrus nattereri]
MAFMDVSSEDIDYEGSDSSEENLASEEQNYRVRLSSVNHTEMCFTNKKEVNKKRVKRVVSCKRKARHLTVTSGVRRRPSINAKTFDAFSKDSEKAGKAEMLEGGHRELRLSVPQDIRMEEDSVIYCDFFSEISKDHKQVTEILFGRNLRLNIAVTLWRRNIGELLSFLIQIRDFSVLVDCLPVFTKSYLISALLWIQAVLTKWLPQLSRVDGGEIGIFSPDYKNIQAVKQQLQGLWRQERQLYFTTEATAEIWKTIQSQLYQL